MKSSASYEGMAQGAGSSLADAAVLVAVIFLHESGHWLAMRAFGYRDVRLFFIPFFGGGTSGRRAGVAAWKEGLVLLAGPLPGIVLGLAIAIFLPAGGPGLLHRSVMVLVFVNAFNLLPLSALDGGRLLQLAIFQRHRWLELAFLLIAAVGSVAVAIALEVWVLGVLAFMTFVTLPTRWRLLDEAHALRQRGLAYPRDTSEADSRAGREVFLAARRLDALTPARSHLDAHFEALIDRVGRAIPSWKATGGLLTAWLFGFVLTVSAVVALGPAEQECAR